MDILYSKNLCQQVINGTKTTAKSKAKTRTGKQKPKHSPPVRLLRVIEITPIQTPTTVKRRRFNDYANLLI